MEGEISNFLMVWTSVFASMCYCYYVAKLIPIGPSRLITFCPVVCLFLILPFNLLHTINLGSNTIFFISWLANSKLLLFAFGLGPLSDPSLSLGRFVALACLPIKFQKSSSPKPPNGSNKENPYINTSQSGLKSLLRYATKGLFLLSIIILHEYYRDDLHPKLVFPLICVFLFMGVEFQIAVVAILARAMLGLELEPPFDEPYLSTSLQDFWGHRWNLMASDILRLTICKPIYQICRPLLGRKWASMAAIMGAFIWSGLYHELQVYYMSREWPTWRATWYFVIHGVCVVAERQLKEKYGGKWCLPQPISRVLTVGFVLITGVWLVTPQLMKFKVDRKIMKEFISVFRFVKDLLGRTSTLSRFNTTTV